MALFHNMNKKHFRDIDVNKSNCKGRFGRVEYDDEAKIFHGEVVGLKDIITFQGRTVAELETAFKDSINDYLAWCKKRKEKPEKTFSGCALALTTRTS